MAANKTLLLTLRVFSLTGGIEKVNRLLGKALYELGLQYGGTTQIYSMYGRTGKADENKYFPQNLFRGFGDNKVRYVLRSVRTGVRCRHIILSHINLLLVGYLVKLFRPGVKLILIAHGIEVWRPIPSWKKRMLSRCDLILPVSHFTKEKMKELYGLPESRFSVFNNCLEPFLEQPLQKEKDRGLLERYGIDKTDRIMLTVSRMSDSEKYKGYDKVMETMPDLLSAHPELRYLLVGKYDEKEKKRLDAMIGRLGLKNHVAFAGFVDDAEMPAHFGLADLFIMPSEKEGFGIVFIEAMFYGLPVIAGNRDGSVDALMNGQLGLLVDPESKEEISDAIEKVLVDRNRYLPDRDKLFENFSYTWYKRKIRNCLERVDD